MRLVGVARVGARRCYSKVSIKPCIFLRAPDLLLELQVWLMNAWPCSTWAAYGSELALAHKGHHRMHLIGQQARRGARFGCVDSSGAAALNSGCGWVVFRPFGLAFAAKNPALAGFWSPAQTRHRAKKSGGRSACMPPSAVGRVTLCRSAYRWGFSIADHALHPPLAPPALTRVAQHHAQRRQCGNQRQQRPQRGQGGQQYRPMHTLLRHPRLPCGARAILPRPTRPWRGQLTSMPSRRQTEMRTAHIDGLFTL